MGLCVISALLVVIPLFSSFPTRSVLPLLFQLQPSFKGYGDSPRPSPISRLHMTEAPSATFLLKKVEPEYPHAAKAAGVEGDVVLRIIIGTDGRVEEIHLRCGKPLLIEAAAKAVSKWQYETFMHNGHAVEVETFCDRPISATQQTSLTCRQGRARFFAAWPAGTFARLLLSTGVTHDLGH
jgi:TonB family protein